MSSHPPACPVCGFPLPDDLALCNHCGAVIESGPGGMQQKGQVCFECGRESESPFERCPGCGAETGVECEDCGALNHVKAETCVKCGKSIDRTRPEEIRPRGLRANAPWPMMLLTVLIVGAFAGLGYLSGKFDRFGQPAVFLFILVIAGLLAAAFWLTRGQRRNASRERSLPRREGGMIEIFRASDITQADLLLEILRKEGVEAMVLNRHFGSFFPFTMKHGLQILAPEPQQNRAREIIRAYSFEAVSSEDEQNRM